MVLSKKKKEKIRKHLEDGKTWDYIRNETGVSNDAINNVRRESSSSSPTSTALQVDKTPRVVQDHTNQKQQPPTTNNNPDPHVLHLEQKINNVDQGLRTNNERLQNVVEILNQLKQSQQPQETKEPHQEKPDNERELDELKNQEIKAKSLPTPAPKVQLPKKNPDQSDALPQETQINPPSPLVPDGQQTPKKNLTQTVTAPENQEDENQVISNYRNAYVFKEATETLPFWIKLWKDYRTYRKTGFFPSTDYQKYAKKTNIEKKIKKPIIDVKPKPSPPPCFRDPQKEKMYRERVADSHRRIEDRLRKTNERLKNPNKYLDNPGTHLIAIG